MIMDLREAVRGLAFYGILAAAWHSGEAQPAGIYPYPVPLLVQWGLGKGELGTLVLVMTLVRYGPRRAPLRTGFARPLFDSGGTRHESHPASWGN